MIELKQELIFLNNKKQRAAEVGKAVVALTSPEAEKVDLTVFGRWGQLLQKSLGRMDPAKTLDVNEVLNRAEALGPKIVNIITRRANRIERIEKKEKDLSAASAIQAQIEHYTKRREDLKNLIGTPYFTDNTYAYAYSKATEEIEKLQQEYDNKLGIHHVTQIPTEVTSLLEPLDLDRQTVDEGEYSSIITGKKVTKYSAWVNKFCVLNRGGEEIQFEPHTLQGKFALAILESPNSSATYPELATKIYGTSEINLAGMINMRGHFNHRYDKLGLQIPASLHHHRHSGKHATFQVELCGPAVIQSPAVTEPKPDFVRFKLGTGPRPLSKLEALSEKRATEEKLLADLIDSSPGQVEMDEALAILNYEFDRKSSAIKIRSIIDRINKKRSAEDKIIFQPPTPHERGLRKKSVLYKNGIGQKQEISEAKAEMEGITKMYDEGFLSQDEFNMALGEYEKLIGRDTLEIH